MKVLIVNGGSLSAEFLEEQYRLYMPDCVIAVDGALKLFYQTGLFVTHIVGDFDTVQDDILRFYQSNGYWIERHIPEKDETDSELAMKLAMSMEPEEIRILGATGYRMDHTLANLQMLYCALGSKTVCRIADEYNEICLIDSEAVFEKNAHFKYLSFLPYTDRVSGITLEGFKYPLNEYCMEKGVMPGFGVSNEITDAQARIKVDKGVLFCIRSCDR